MKHWGATPRRGDPPSQKWSELSIDPPLFLWLYGQEVREARQDPVLATGDGIIRPKGKKQGAAPRSGGAQVTSWPFPAALIRWPQVTQAPQAPAVPRPLPLSSQTARSESSHWPDDDRSLVNTGPTRLTAWESLAGTSVEGQQRESAD